MLGFSPEKNLRKIIRCCTEDRFVLDNWSTEDKLGGILHEECPEATIIVLFDSYPNILERYRCDVKGEDAFYMMYEKMYCKLPFEDYHSVRYLKVGEDYTELTAEEFRSFIASHLSKDTKMKFNQETWTWKKNCR